MSGRDESVPGVLVLGQTPPPVHGQALAIENLLQIPSHELRIVFMRMRFSDDVAEIGKFRLKKVLHLFSLIHQAIRQLRNCRSLILYYPPAAAVIPVLRDIFFLKMVRPFAPATVLHFHAGGVSQTIRSRWWLRWLAGNVYQEVEAAVHLLPSAAAEESCFRPKRTFCVPNGLDIPLVQRSRLPGHNLFRVLLVGLLSAKKGTGLAIEIAGELKRRGVRFEVRLVGEWESQAECERCERIAAERDVVTHVSFAGILTGEAKWQEYSDADAFLFPSYHETESMPLVLIEAMAYSLPIVAGRWRHIPDIVEDGTTGCLFPIKDVGAAAELLRQLAESEELRQSLGSAGRKRYEENYTLSRHLTAMKDVFQAVYDAHVCGRELWASC